MREYTDEIKVKLLPGEKKKIRERMREAGMINMSAFVRKMAINGCIIKLDLSDVKEVSRLLHINSNNINQIAKKANQTDYIDTGELKIVIEQQKEIWKVQKQILQRIASIRE